MSIEVMKQALDALYDIDATGVPVGHIDLVIDTLRLAIEQAEKQEPHYLHCICGAGWEISADGGEELVDAPPQRQSSSEELRVMLDAANETDPSRWEIGFRNIVAALHGPRHPFEIADIVAEVKRRIAPPQRQPLTKEEIWREYQGLWPFHPAEEPKLAADIVTLTSAIERKHGIGGGE